MNITTILKCLSTRHQNRKKHWRFCFRDDHRNKFNLFLLRNRHKKLSHHYSFLLCKESTCLISKRNQPIFSAIVKWWSVKNIKVADQVSTKWSNSICQMLCKIHSHLTIDQTTTLLVFLKKINETGKSLFTLMTKQTIHFICLIDSL